MSDVYPNNEVRNARRAARAYSAPLPRYESTGRKRRSRVAGKPVMLYEYADGVTTVWDNRKLDVIEAGVAAKWTSV